MSPASSPFAPHRGSAPGPRWGVSVPQTPCFVPPLSKFLATPLIALTLVHQLWCISCLNIVNDCDL